MGRQPADGGTAGIRNVLDSPRDHPRIEQPRREVEVARPDHGDPHFLRPWHSAPVQGPQGILLKSGVQWLDRRQVRLAPSQRERLLGPLCRQRLVPDKQHNPRIRHRGNSSKRSCLRTEDLRVQGRGGRLPRRRADIRLATGHHCGIRRIRARCQRPVECHRADGCGLPGNIQRWGAGRQSRRPGLVGPTRQRGNSDWRYDLGMESHGHHRAQDHRHHAH